MEKIYTPCEDYKVLVRCITYNQSSYIEDALNGFAIQETNFPYVCLILDDASTDGEQNIISTWVQRECDINRAKYVEIEQAFITIIPHRFNIHCVFAIYYLKQNLYKRPKEKDAIIRPWRNHSIYEALCEGDDYWIAKDKLQIQVNCLDNDLLLGMCYTDFNILYQNSGVFDYSMFKTSPNVSPIYESNPCRFLLDRGYVAPPSWMYRISCIPYIDILETAADGSFVWFVHFLATSNVKFIDKTTAVYRVLAESAAHSTDYEKIYNREKNILETQLKLIDYYGFPQSLKQECIQNYYRHNLSRFILNNKTEDIFDAKRIIKVKTIREKILFLVSKFGFLINLFRRYYCFKKGEKVNRFLRASLIGKIVMRIHRGIQSL